jgi:hypothetical protein
MKGRINFGLAEQYSKDSLKIARDENCSKFIIDHKQTILKEKNVNIHCSGEDLEQFGFKNSHKIAIIVEDLNHNINLVDSTGDNVSWSTFKYFNSNEIEKAFSWLA